MVEELTIFSSTELKNYVEDLRELISQSHLAFLLGAGCSQNAGLPLMSQLTEEVLKHNKIGAETRKLLDVIEEGFNGAKSTTIEDYMSEIVDLLSIAERRLTRGSKNAKIPLRNLDLTANELQTAISEIQLAIVSTIGDKEVDVTSHQQFVRAIHGSLQAGKADRGVDYFVLNYDTLIEDALGLERVKYCDGFSGGTTGWWEPNLFSEGQSGTRVFKIHGSIDWCLLENDPLPRRVRSGIKSETRKKHILIYPAATKYQETQRDPFAQLLLFMRQSLGPAEGTEMVLAICGYNFGDSHINLEIENALHQSNGRLTVALFTSTVEPGGKVSDWLTDTSINEQIRVYSSKGFYHGANKIESDDQIPWWRFEILTRLLGGER